MAVEMKPGLWKRRDGLAVTVWPFQDGGWMGSDGNHRWNDGLYASGSECVLDLVEFISKPKPQPQPDAAEKLAALKDDRDKWQTRAVQAEGRLKTMGQELATARQQLQDRDAADQVPGNEQLRQQITQLIAEREKLQTKSKADAAEIGEWRDQVKQLRKRLDHAEQQRSILLETSQDQLGQIRMAERIVSLMADKVAQLAVEGT